MVIERTTRKFPRKDVVALRKTILSGLQASGFIINGRELSFEPSKDSIRALHEPSVNEMRNKYSRSLKEKEPELLEYIANGVDIIPKNIEPELVYVDSNTKYWDLFNYIKVHWSIPISMGYGRRLCYVVFDKANGKAIGIIGLTDPVFKIPARDNHIGWNKADKNEHISKMMDGYVIGAVTPYSKILGGKLVGSLLFSNQVREDFKNKYAGKKSLMLGREHTGELVLISTLSALGKSAVYDRLKLSEEQRFISCGYSNGWGEFQFNGDTYKEMLKLVKIYGTASIKSSDWGSGYRNKREVVQKALRLLDIPGSYMRHGINREQFILPLARNYKDSLINGAEPDYYDNSVESISSWIKERWIIPRSVRTQAYLDWNRNDYRLWTEVYQSSEVDEGTSSSSLSAASSSSG